MVYTSTGFVCPRTAVGITEKEGGTKRKFEVVRGNSRCEVIYGNAETARSV